MIIHLNNEGQGCKTGPVGSGYWCVGSEWRGEYGRHTLYTSLKIE
jgi:hypothetical protein